MFHNQGISYNFPTIVILINQTLGNSHMKKRGQLVVESNNIIIILAKLIWI